MFNASFIKNIGLIFFVRFFGAIATVLVSFAVTRNLPSDEAGKFFLAFTLLTVIGTLSTLGLTTAFVRFVGGAFATNNWGVINGVVRAGLKYAIGFSLVVSLVLFFSSELLANSVFNDNGMSVLIKIVAVSVPFFCLYQLIGFAFQGLHKPKIAACICFILAPLIFLAVAFVLVNSLTSYYAKEAMMCFGLGAFITAIMALASWYSQSSTKIAADFSETDDLLKSAMPIWAAMAMTMTVQWGGQLISGMYLPADELAVVFVALRFSLLTSFILIAINLYASPKFAASAKTNKIEEIRATSFLCSRVILCVATPAVLVLFVGAEFFMSLFGESYRQGANILRILIVGQYVNVITGSVGFILNMTGHEKDMRNVVFLSGPLALILGFALIPVYGMTGAAISTAVAVASQNLLAVRLVKKRLGFNTLNVFTK